MPEGRLSKRMRVKRDLSLLTRAELRKELRHPLVNRYMKGALYAELLRRRRHAERT